MQLPVCCFGVATPCDLFLPPPTKLRQGNVFKSMCQEFCSGEVAEGACMAWDDGGHVWQGAGMAGCVCCRGVCVTEGIHGWGCAWQEKWPLQRLVRILLECILVRFIA